MNEDLRFLFGGLGANGAYKRIHVPFTLVTELSTSYDPEAEADVSATKVQYIQVDAGRVVNIDNSEHNYEAIAKLMQIDYEIRGKIAPFIKPWTERAMKVMKEYFKEHEDLINPEACIWKEEKWAKYFGELNALPKDTEPPKETSEDEKVDVDGKIAEAKEKYGDIVEEWNMNTVTAIAKILGVGKDASKEDKCQAIKTHLGIE